MKMFLKRHGRTIAKWALGILATLIVLGVLAWLIWLGYFYEWTGFGFYTNTKGEVERAKTVWDWLDLLIVPAVVAIGGLVFTRTERKAKEAAEERRAEAERELTTERARESALQDYLDKMTRLLLENKLRDSGPDAEVRGIARARTLTVLRMLDEDRKGLLMRFLFEMELIGSEPLVELFRADLSRANLSGAFLAEANLGLVDLSGANLSYAFLSAANLNHTSLGEANLREASLNGAFLSWAILHKADLRGADLRGAALIEADLRGANLSEANLSEADLREANLKGADLKGADLKGADLRGAKVTDEQLARAKSLVDATSPTAKRTIEL